METDCAAQVSEDCPAVEDGDNVVEVPVLSEHSESLGVPCPSHGAMNCCVDGQQNQIITLSEYGCPQKTQTETNTKRVESTMVTEGIMNSAHELNGGSAESNQAVTTVESSSLTSNEVQTVVGLAGDLCGAEQKIHHLVTLASVDTEKTLFQISGFNSEYNKTHRVVTLVNGLDSTTQTKQHTVALLSNVMEQKACERSTVTDVSLTDRSDPSQENVVILPLGDAKVAVIHDDNFSNSRFVFNDQTTLLGMVPQQSESIQQQPEKSSKEVTVYHLH